MYFEFYTCKLNDLPEIYFHIKVSLYVDHRKKKKKKAPLHPHFFLKGSEYFFNRL